MKIKRIIRVGILGGGAIAQRRHLPEYAANPNVEIVGIYDALPERAQELAEEYGCKAYASPEEMIDDETIDAISVCSPNVTHADFTIRGLMAGKHVLCEKPMALTLDETRRMLEAEETSGKILMLGHNQRMMAAHRKAREILLHDHAIGKLLFFQSNFKHPGPEAWSVDQSKNTWFFNKSMASFGVMGDLGAHKIDLIRFLTGAEITRVLGRMMTLDKRYEDGRLIDLEDNAVCQFEMDNGMPGIMHFSWSNYGNEDNSTIIYGDKGVMKIYGDYASDIILEMRDGTTVRYSVGGASTNTEQKKSGVIDEFVASIIEKRMPIVTGVDGHNTLAVINKAIQSDAEGRWLDIEY